MTPKNEKKQDLSSKLREIEKARSVAKKEAHKKRKQVHEEANKLLKTELEAAEKSYISALVELKAHA